MKNWSRFDTWIVLCVIIALLAALTGEWLIVAVSSVLIGLIAEVRKRA